MSRDGSSIVRISAEGMGWRTSTPCFSPDGRFLAFTSYRDGNLRNLTLHKGHDARPAWFPEGGRIAFESDRFGDLEICIPEVATGEVANLTGHPRKDREPSWPATAGSPPTSRLPGVSYHWLAAPLPRLLCLGQPFPGAVVGGPEVKREYLPDALFQHERPHQA